MGPVFRGDAGIAIGPILFIIAILGILASAIAAGSGSFTAGTATESNRTKASALIDIGQNLKIGWDRIIGYGILFNNVVIGASNTSNTVDLFSPTGGGIIIPSRQMANDPTNDIWYYPKASVPKIGSGGANTDQLAMLKVAQGVCDEVNIKIINTTTPAAGDISGNIHTNGTLTVTNWPTALASFMTGCLQNSNATDGGYWFYQVMGVR